MWLDWIEQDPNPQSAHRLPKSRQISVTEDGAQR